MTKGHRIEKPETPQEFLNRISSYDKDAVECSRHADFRLGEAQRGVFDCDKLKQFLFHETPVRCGFQYNGLYSAFYSFEKNRIIRIVLELTINKAYITTFYVISKESLPRG